MNLEVNEKKMPVIKFKDNLLRAKALELYKKGSEKWSKDYAFGRIVKARRYVKKFEANLKSKNYKSYVKDTM